MLLVLCAIAMSRGLNVDEHQFVASGALLAREGFLPYRDYPFFHTPNLPLVYALLFRGADYLLLSARLLSVLCAFLGLIFISCTMWRSLSGHSGTFRVFITASAAILFFSNPVVRYSCWRAWNHPLATLLATTAVLCLWRALDDRKSGRWYFAAGLLLSLAIGTRLTFAPLGLAFAGSLFLPAQIDIRARMRNALLLAGGGVIGASPMLWLFALDARAFIFNNFTWNGVINELYQRAAGKYVGLGSKLFYIVTNVLRNPGNLALLLLFLAVQYAALRQREFRRDPRNLIVLVSLPCLLIGALAPAIPYDQYFYEFVPILVLGLVPPVVALARAEGLQRSLCWGFGAAAVIGLFSTGQDFWYVPKLATPSRWTPIVLHRAGLKLAQIADPGPVLTLAPITPLEGRLRIYRALATSPYAWITAGFLSEEQRREFGFITPQNLASTIEPRPPGAICTRNQRRAEESMLRYKDSLGYISFGLPNGETAWVSQH